jgi:hypothetical protein
MNNGIKVVLEKSDNYRLEYPIAGRLQIQEVYLGGTIKAAFQPGTYDSNIFQPSGGPVDVPNPVFHYGRNVS